MEAGALPIGTAIVHGRERAKNTDMQYKSIFFKWQMKMSTAQTLNFPGKGCLLYHSGDSRCQCWSLLLKLLSFFLLLLSSTVFFSGSEVKFFCPRCSCVFCAWVQIGLYHSCHFPFFLHLLFLWEMWEPARKRKVLPFCWISLDRTASAHLLMERELVLQALSLSGLVGRIQAT